MAITPDGAFAYVVNRFSGNVSVIDVASNTVTTTVSVGDPDDASFVAITPDGAFAYVTNTESGKVSVIDVASNTVTTTVSVGLGPAGVAITPAIISPEDAIAAVISDVDDLLAAGSLSSAHAQSLTKKLTDALEKLEQGKTMAALDKMQGFIDKVNDYINDGVLTTAEGQPLIDAANDIIDLINSSSSLAKQGNEDASSGLAGALPVQFTLAQNYPNPFNPTTTISFALPEAASVQLTVYDINGREVRSLISSSMEAGEHHIQWDATNNNGARVASGIYIYRLQAGSFIQMRKMTLLR